MKRSGRSCWVRFPPRIQSLMLLLATILAIVAGSAARPVGWIEGRLEREEDQEQLDGPQGDDTECLRGIVASVRQEREPEDEKLSNLVTWTETEILNPCNHTSPVGITCNNSRIAAISLPSKGLVGDIPSSLASCYFLQTLDLSWNSLSGALPTWLGSMAYLSVLLLSNNNFSGQIPYELATLASLTSLDLTHNQLSGSIPPQLGLLSLQVFNVSNNKLAGRVPTTLSNTSSGAPRFDASCFANNFQLYGYPLPNMVNTPPTIIEQKGLPVRTIIFIGLVSGLGSLTFSCYGVWLWMIIKNRRESAEKADKESSARTTRKPNEESKENFGWKDALEHLGS